MIFNVEHYTAEELLIIKPQHLKKYKINPDEQFVFEKKATAHCAIVKTQWIEDYLAELKKAGLNYRKGPNVISVELHHLIKGAIKWRGLQNINGAEFKRVYQKLVATNSFNLIEQVKQGNGTDILKRKYGLDITVNDDPNVFRRVVNKKGLLIGWSLEGQGLKVYRSNVKSTDWLLDCTAIGVKGLFLCRVDETAQLYDNNHESRAIARYIHLRLNTIQNKLPELKSVINEFTQ